VNVDVELLLLTLLALVFRLSSSLCLLTIIEGLDSHPGLKFSFGTSIVAIRWHGIVGMFICRAVG